MESQVATTPAGTAGDVGQAVMQPEERQGLARAVPFAIAVLCFCCLSGFLGYVAYFPIFSWFPTYDDAGYWLISLRSYAEHGSLYHHTYSQCGPLYYELWSLFFSLTHLSIDPDTAHFLTLGVWILTALMIGGSLSVLTRSILVGLFAELVAFMLLFALINEPMEPAGLAYFFAATVLLGIALVWRTFRRIGFAIMGAAAASAILTKVNVGAFLVIGLAVAFLVCWHSIRYVRLRHVLAIALLFVAPVALMAQNLGELWVQQYLGLFEASALGVVAALTTWSRSDLADRTLSSNRTFYAIGGGLAVGLVSSIGVLVNGTSLSQLLDGAFLSQRNLATIFQIPLPITRDDAYFAVACAVIAAAVAALERWHTPVRPSRTSLGATGRLLAGLWILVTAFGSFAIPHIGTLHVPGQSFLLAVPLIWVVLVKPGEPNLGISIFPRVAIALIALFGCLESYPVSGSQFSWAGVLLVPVGALLLGDGLAQLRTLGFPLPATSNHRFRIRSVGTVLSGVLALVAALLLWSSSTSLLDTYRTAYELNPAIASAGSQRIHLGKATVLQFGAISKFLQNNCSTFQSMPGLNSFYFFAHQQPPTGLNTTQWMNLLSGNQQEEIVRVLRHVRRLCVIESPSILAGWDQGRPVKQTPLVRYLEANFVQAQVVGPYDLMTRR